MLKDKNGRGLENGLYIGPDPIDRGLNIYEIKASSDTFSAEYWNGFLKITNFEEAAKHFSRLNLPATNCRFLGSKVRQHSEG